MHTIAIIGTGYVGLVTGACLADFGLDVRCVDIDVKKLEGLKQGEIPIYENGLDMVVSRNVKTGRLQFTSDLTEAVRASEVIFLAVGTPPLDDGSVDLSHLHAAIRDVAKSINGYKVIVTKSTVPVGTTRKMKEMIHKVLADRKEPVEFDVISNPEFLREGSAVFDFMHPDRVILGFDSQKALDIMKSVYRVLYLNETPFIETTIETSEMIKYASNAFLALKITYINQIANLCEATNANVLDVSKAMGKDGRIGSKFLHPGPGYGGSCFPKDTLALAHLGKVAGVPVTLIEETIRINEDQKKRMIRKIESHMGAIRGTTIAMLGLAFKPNTDDMREAPALTIIEHLCKGGAALRVFDPAAEHEAKKLLGNLGSSITYCQGEYETVADTDALIIMTEWNQFRNLNLDKIRELMRGSFFFDFRNVYRRNMVEQAGFTYEGVGC